MTTAPTPTPQTYLHKVVIAVAISMAALLLTAFVYVTVDILVLLFAGVLFAVFLSAPSDLLATHTKLPRHYALLIVLLTFFLLTVGGGYFMGYTVYRQSQQLRRTIPGALKQLETDLHKYLPAPRAEESPATIPGTTLAATTTSQPAPPTTQDAGIKTSTETTVIHLPPPTPTQWLAERLIAARQTATDFFTSETFVRHAGGVAGGVVSSTFGLIGNAVVIFGVGLFFAINPRLYSRGLISMVPIPRRQRAAHVLSEIGSQLQWWFVGQLCSMASIGLLTFIGLACLGVPMAFTLAILAALMNFIPNFGPILAAIPAVLVAFAPHGNSTELNPSLALYTVILYIIIQLLEGWVITPFFQKRAVELPPALIIIAQMLFALLLGPIGLILATPMLAATLVIFRMLYLEDLLGDKPAPESP